MDEEDISEAIHLEILNPVRDNSCFEQIDIDVIGSLANTEGRSSGLAEIQPFNHNYEDSTISSESNVHMQLQDTRRLKISPLLIPMLISELILSLIDFLSDFWSGITLLKLPNKAWGIGSLVINWIPGVVAVFQILANHRCDQFGWIISSSVACLTLCPLIPTLTYAFLIYKSPRNSREELSEDFATSYSKVLSFVVIVRALEGCIESPLQLIYKTFLMFNGIIDFSFTNPTISVQDLHGNNLSVPFFINFLISSMTLLKSVYKLNMPFFKAEAESKYFSKLAWLDFVSFLATSTLFRLSSLILLFGYLNFYTILPMMILVFLGACVNFKTIRYYENIPNWLLVFMNLFVPICFTTDSEENISEVQIKNLKCHTWTSSTIYCLSLITLGLLVYFSKLNMNPDIPINFPMFKLFISTTICLGILAFVFSFRLEVFESRPSWMKMLLSMAKILRIFALVALFIALPIIISSIHDVYLTIWDKTNSQPKVFRALEIVPMEKPLTNFKLQDIEIVSEEEVHDRTTKVLQTRKKLCIVLSNQQSEKPSSPNPYSSIPFDIPTILLRNKDKNAFIGLIKDSNENNYVQISNQYNWQQNYQSPKGGKLVFFSGLYNQSFANGKIVEVIDVMNPNSVCSFGTLPIGVEMAVGGNIGHQFLLCGGLRGHYISDATDKCYVLENDHPFIRMNDKRYAAQGVVLPNNTFFVIGGYDVHGNRLKSTELISMSPPSATYGPVLPNGISSHCSVIIGKLVFLIGGHSSSRKAMAINIETGEVSHFPDLNIGRPEGHSCITYRNDNGKDVILVVGGCCHEDGDLGISSEIMVIDINKLFWTRGPNLLEPCRRGSLVSSHDGDWIVLLGCYDNPGKIYKLQGQTWTLSKRELKHPKSSAVALKIPDHLAHCYHGYD